jgi:hypothetical protein
MMVAGGMAYAAGRRAGATEDYQEQPQYQDEPQQEVPPAPPAPAATSENSIDELQRLADLHSSGVLTDEEFSAAKAKILGT